MKLGHLIFRLICIPPHHEIIVHALLFCAEVKAAHLSEILVNFAELRDVTHQEKGFFFSVITICEAYILYSYDAHL